LDFNPADREEPLTVLRVWSHAQIGCKEDGLDQRKIRLETERLEGGCYPVIRA
jgi:hypothetical protein